MKKVNSAFRAFMYDKWLEHKDEIFEWTKGMPEYDEKYYFSKHKWMLKKMFKEKNSK